MTAPKTPAPPAVSAWRLISTLGGAGAVAGFLIVFVFGWTQSPIQAHKARVLAQAVAEVLGNPSRYDTLFVLDGALARALPESATPADYEQVYLGFDEGDRVIGFAVVANKAGFQDNIRLIYGYDAAASRLIGMKVLENKETPGLGDKIEKDSAFVTGFRDVATPLSGAKRGRKDNPSAPGGVDMITGATISSRAVIRAINESLARLGPRLTAYLSDRQAAGPASPATDSNGPAGG
ncbi:MAG TPA: RnfABCDGE type electron transport complex subunit G [Gemmatimonadales bacterium]